MYFIVFCMLVSAVCATQPDGKSDWVAPLTDDQQYERSKYVYQNRRHLIEAHERSVAQHTNSGFFPSLANKIFGGIEPASWTKTPIEQFFQIDGWLQTNCTPAATGTRFSIACGTQLDEGGISGGGTVPPFNQTGVPWQYVYIGICNVDSATSTLMINTWYDPYMQQPYYILDDTSNTLSVPIDVCTTINPTTRGPGGMPGLVSYATTEISPGEIARPSGWFVVVVTMTVLASIVIL